MSANLPPHRGLPFGLAGSQPVFDRATDMAVAMFDGYAAVLAIVHQGRMWRSRDPEGRLPKTSVLAEQVISSGAPLWVEDLTDHPVSAGHPLVVGGDHLRFYLGVPVLSRDGEVIGVLSVLGLHPKPFDAMKLRMLQQLAEFVADECFRQLGALELEETQSALSAFVKAVPASVMVSDREMRVLQASLTWLTSAEGRCSTFRVVLPLERIGHKSAEAAPIETGGGVATLEPERALRVLAAEDNSVNQLVLKTLLQQVGVEVFVVGDGQQVLEAWRAHDWDLILMDVQMPLMDGPSATVAIRADEARSGRARTPIIALTANAMAHQTVEYLAVGMDGFVAKPIDAAKLFQAIAEAIEAGDQQAERVAAC